MGECAHPAAARALCLIAFTLFLLFAMLIGYLGIPPLAREMTHVFNDFEAIVLELAQRLIGSGKISLLGQPMDAEQFATTVGDGLRNWFAQTSVLATLGAAVVGTMFGLILTLVLLFYFLLSGPSMAHGLLKLVSPRQRPLIMHIWTVLDPVLKRYFIGVLVVVAYAAAAAYVGLGLVLGIPHAVLLALLTGVLEMIHVIGPGAAAVIAGLVAIHSAAGIGAIIAYALYATALRISIDQLFGPLALGQRHGWSAFVRHSWGNQSRLRCSVTSRSRMRWQANESSSADRRAQRRKCQKVDATFSAFGGF